MEKTVSNLGFFLLGNPEKQPRKADEKFILVLNQSRFLHFRYLLSLFTSFLYFEVFFRFLKLNRILELLRVGNIFLKMSELFICHKIWEVCKEI